MEFKNKQFRSATLSRESVNTTDRTIELAFSSETPYERMFGTEILGHNSGECDLSRLNNAAPFLDGHDTNEQIGVVLSARIDPDKVGRAVVKISRSEDGEEIFQDIIDGIKTKISVGYIVDKFEEVPTQDGTKAYRATKWIPLEISVVSIPADYTVGIGRSAEDNTVPAIPEVEPVPVESEETAAPEVPAAIEPSEAVQEVPVVEEAKEETLVAPVAEVVVVEEIKAMATPVITITETPRKELERVSEINALADRFKGRINNMESLRSAALNQGLTVSQFKDKIKMETNETVNATVIGLTEKEVKNFSLHRLIRSQMPGVKEDAGYEKELSQEVAKRLGTSPQGFYVPGDVLKRDQQSGSATHGQALVGTSTQGFIPFLYENLVSAKLGVTMMPGLVGNIAIPKRTGTSTAGWVTEGNATTESSGSIGNITMSPKTLTGFVDFSRLLMLQSTPTIEGLVRDDLARQLAIAVDKAIFHGTGANGQPTGIVSASGVTSASMASFGILSASALESNVLSTNLSGANLKYVTTPALYSALKARAQQAGYPVYLINDNKMLGYDVVFSNVVSPGFVIFGDFSNIMLGEWGALDILVDPYTASSTGNVRVNAFMNVDVANRYASAFSFGYSAS